MPDLLQAHVQLAFTARLRLSGTAPPGLRYRVRDGLVSIVQGERSDVELAEVQQPGPDQRDHPKTALGANIDCPWMLMQFRMIQG